MEHSHDNHTPEPYKYAVHHSEEEGKKITVEVTLGLIWKNIGVTWGMVKMTFIILTVAKAYYIVAYYMHLKHEVKILKNTVIVPFVFFALYLLYHILTEGVYSEMMENWLY